MRGRTVRRPAAVMVLAMALVAGACGGSNDAGGSGDDGGASSPEAAVSTPEDVASTPDAQAGEHGIAVASTSLGDVLVDADGMTLYAFEPDAQGAPTCEGACADNWPLSEGPATAGAGVDASLLGTVDNPAGATQVTYNGWPLYTFVGDSAPGDVNGQGVGDKWYAVHADGSLVGEGEASSGY